MAPVRPSPNTRTSQKVWSEVSGESKTEKRVKRVAKRVKRVTKRVKPVTKRVKRVKRVKHVKRVKRIKLAMATTHRR